MIIIIIDIITVGTIHSKSKCYFTTSGKTFLYSLYTYRLSSSKCDPMQQNILAKRNRPELKLQVTLSLSMHSPFTMWLFQSTSHTWTFGRVGHLISIILCMGFLQWRRATIFWGCDATEYIQQEINNDNSHKTVKSRLTLYQHSA